MMRWRVGRGKDGYEDVRSVGQCQLLLRVVGCLPAHLARYDKLCAHGQASNNP